MRARFLAICFALLVPASVVGATCGDGTVDAGEQCDDSNTTSGDGCSATCQLEGCPMTGTWEGSPLTPATWSLLEDGAGTITGVTYGGFDFTVTGARLGAAVSITLDGSIMLAGTMLDCDTVEFPSFSFSIVRLRNTYCGDGTVQAPESCDDGNFADGDGCSRSCETPACGDGIVDPGEACDDGNTIDGDGCTATCTVQVCGNGTVEPGEACDDGNATPGDGCSSCQVQTCGNSVIETGEQCDDGNAAGGDGCSATCQFEGCTLTGTWTGSPIGTMTWSLVEGAGGAVTGVTYGFSDFTITGTRFGGAVNLTFSGTSILPEGTMVGCNTVFFPGFNFSIVRERSTYCGDGTTQVEEACDDGNFADGDGCGRRCLLPVCGDGYFDPGEACDDGNTTNGDGCTATCTVQVCGNGTVEPGEACDDGNSTTGDGCFACQVQVCGNGVLEPGEQCDDGNATSGDGCSAACQFEGCSMTGTWTGGPAGFLYEWTIVEAGGDLSGFAFPVGSSGLGSGTYVITGTRTGGNVVLHPGTLTFDGLMIDCSTVRIPAFPFEITRVRATYCGDGVLQPLDEACDDGNLANGDACTAACTAPSGCGDGIVGAGEACDDANANNQDACLVSCAAAVCGDGWVRTGVEACDDGNTSGGDGCAADCLSLDVETASGEVGGGSLTVTTDTESGGDGATPSDPVETTIVAPSGTFGGTLSITEQAAPPDPPAGFVFMGTLVEVEATDLLPAPTATSPLVLTFVIDASQIAPGQDETTIALHKDGAAVPGCGGPAGEASPDPCVSVRERLPDDDVRIGVLTSTLSEWDFSGNVCGGAPALGCQTAFAAKAKLKIRRRESGDVAAWSWKSSATTPATLFGNPSAGTSYTLCIYDETGAIGSLTAPAGGTCRGKACWKAKEDGFKYADRDGTPDGVTKLGLKAGAAGRGKAVVRVKGGTSLPAPPFALPVRVQLRSADGACFESHHVDAKVNDAAKFQSTSD